MWESENQDESPLMTTDNFHGIDRLGYIDLEQRTLQTIDNPFGTRLSPMS
jgi:hypothetical protein